MRKVRKRHDLLLWYALLITGVLVVGMGLYLKYGICEPMGIFQDENPITLPFAMLSKERMEQELAMVEARQEKINTPTESSETTVPVTQEPTKASEAETTEASEPTDPVDETQPRFEVPVYGEDEHYFDDVLFIGDSRTCGLRDYARLGNAEYFCNVGMSVYSASYETAEDLNFSETGLWDLLELRTYGKIYIALGINEAGSDLDDLMDTYQAFVERILEYQPDAVIVINSVMTVGRGKAASEWYFSVDRIELINLNLSTLADGKQIYYIDVNEVFSDEEGYLPEEMSGDGCHLYGRYYEDWARWLCDSVAYLT